MSHSPNSIPFSRFPLLPLLLAVLSLFIALPFLVRTLQGYYSFPLLLFTAIPALLSATGALVLGIATLKYRPPGKPFGYAMGGSYLGGFAIVFWVVMLPLLFLILLPNMEREPEDPRIAQSEKQMRILIRQMKAFHHEHDRLPTRIEELADKEFVDWQLLYDPRDRVKDTPSYRIIHRELPPMEDWADIPALEGRWPDEHGNRLLGYFDERIEHIPNHP